LILKSDHVSYNGELLSTSKLNLFQSIDDKQWHNWKWHVQHAVRNYTDLLKLFPGMAKVDKDIIEEYCELFQFGITPYLLSLIELDNNGNPLPSDPIWKQSCYRRLQKEKADFEYDGVHQNWEKPEEMHYGILHHKYPGRVLIRLIDACFGYCNYCYVTHRTLDKKKESSHPSYHIVWDKILKYLKNRTDIYEVLLSGGDPLLFDNDQLANILQSIRSIPTIKHIRLNTRALTYCPFRFDLQLIEILKAYSVTALEVHFCSKHELTKNVDDALRLFNAVGYRPLILWRAPLLKGVNDSVEELENLLLALYERNITPYYLFHYAPYTLGRESMGLPVRHGVELLRVLRRRIPGPAVPRYTLFHITGKQDVPFDLDGTSEFCYEQDAHGKPIIRFVNWKGEWVTYPDIEAKTDS
jgi:lysine 2,3-aminomutase